MQTWILSRLKLLVALVFIGGVLSANKACREDYFFATQSDVSSVATATPTPDPDATSTPAPTRTPTRTVSAGTPTPEPVGTPTPTPTVSTASLGLALLRDFEEASEKEPRDVSPPLVQKPVSNQSSREGGNWLGTLYKPDDKDQEPRALYVAATGVEAGFQRKQIFRAAITLPVVLETYDQGPELDQMLPALKPDVILYEYVEADRDACDTMRRMKSRSGKTIPLIVVDTRGSATNQPECLPQIASVVLSRTVSRRNVREALEIALQRTLGEESLTR